MATSDRAELWTPEGRAIVTAMMVEAGLGPPGNWDVGPHGDSSAGPLEAAVEGGAWKAFDERCAEHPLSAVEVARRLTTTGWGVEEAVQVATRLC